MISLKTMILNYENIGAVSFFIFSDRKICQLLCKSSIHTFFLLYIETRMLGRIVLRYKVSAVLSIEAFYEHMTILEVWSHTDKISNDAYAMNKFEGIYESLLQFYDKKFLLPKEMVFELHCRDYINRHAISDKGYMKEIGKGLYLDLCAYDHSCRPNAIYTCDGFVATLRGLNSNIDIKDRTKRHGLNRFFLQYRIALLSEKIGTFFEYVGGFIFLGLAIRAAHPERLSEFIMATKTIHGNSQFQK
uniref:SET domain-containing protein n=1 Tax=Angiostrongylus cantonensis TaxID=6313 RepID=A0A0K0DNR9_ANGCA